MGTDTQTRSPAEPRSRSDEIAALLEEQILTGRFLPGARLDEVSLAEEHRVSRTPIREAFQKLALSGLVDHAPRRGVFVRQTTAVEIMEMFEVMAEFEATCGRLAALRSSEAEVEALRRANAACRLALETGGIDGYYEANGAFHQLIYEQSGNRYLAQEATRLHRRLKPYRRMQLHLRGRPRQSMEEHEGIVNAIAAGDAEGAAHLLRAHVGVQGEKFHHLLSQLRIEG